MGYNHVYTPSELFAAVVGAGITILGGLFIGGRLSANWAIYQKRRELELAAATKLYELYGEFFAVSKLWAAYKNETITTQELKLCPDIRRELLNRAAAVEGGLEALLVQLASERELEKESETLPAQLGRFRQSFQRLREAIRENKALGWTSSDHPEYLTFKRLSCLVAHQFSLGKARKIRFLRPPKDDPRVDPDTAYKNLYEITSNRHQDREKGWIDVYAENNRENEYIKDEFDEEEWREHGNRKPHPAWRR
jgi:hypothetical protein